MARSKKLTHSPAELVEGFIADFPGSWRTMEVMSAKWYLTGSTGVVTVITFLGCVKSLLSTETPKGS